MLLKRFYELIKKSRINTQHTQLTPRTPHNNINNNTKRELVVCAYEYMVAL